jgi:hypothetical protein
MPWVSRQRCASRGFIAGRDDQQRVTAVYVISHRATEQHDAAFCERVHERRVFIPAILLSPQAGGVARGSVTVPDQEERHDQTVAAHTDNGLVVSSRSLAGTARCGAAYGTGMIRC